MKTCLRCGETKPPAEFPEARNKDGLHSYCRPCLRNYQRQYRQRPGVRERKNELEFKRRHKLPQRPEGPCMLCGRCGPLVPDHDHSCCPGDFSCEKCQRGLLCRGCNGSLGALGDTLEALERVVEYLRNPPGIPVEYRYKWVRVDPGEEVA